MRGELGVVLLRGCRMSVSIEAYLTYKSTTINAHIIVVGKVSVPLSSLLQDRRQLLQKQLLYCDKLWPIFLVR